MEQVRGVAALVLLSIVIVFSYRGGAYCWEAFRDDSAGKWITIGEALSTIAWSLIAIDALLAFIGLRSEVLGLVFWIAFIIKAVAAILKSVGYGVVRDTYRGFR